MSKKYIFLSLVLMQFLSFHAMFSQRRTRWCCSARVGVVYVHHCLRAMPVWLLYNAIGSFYDKYGEPDMEVRSVGRKYRRIAISLAGVAAYAWKKTRDDLGERDDII